MRTDEFKKWLEESVTLSGESQPNMKGVLDRYVQFIETNTGTPLFQDFSKIMQTLAKIDDQLSTVEHLIMGVWSRTQKLEDQTPVYGDNNS